jgi:hypothetical protein
MACANLPRTLLAAGFVFAAVPLGAAAALAQTSPGSDEINQIATCEAQQTGRGIEQDAFGRFPTRCMTEVVGASEQDKFAECRSQARARENDGEAYARFLNMCMAAPSSDAAAVSAEAPTGSQ